MKYTKYLIIGLLLMSCTSNTRARKWGGNEDIKLQPNEVLVNMTWKESSLWILTKDTISNTFYFREDSPYGVMEGQVTIK